MTTQSDTPGEGLADEFSRLVREYLCDDGSESTKAEAWNLIADFAVCNADAISAALSPSVASDTAALPSGYEGLVERGRSIVDRRDFTFAECSLAEEVMGWVEQAIAALGRVHPVAWQWRHRSKRKDDSWSAWSEWKPGRREPIRGGGYESEERPLYDAPPAPQPALALIEELERALEPFAEVASEWDGEPASLHVFLEWNDEKAPVPSLPVDLFRAARTALASAKRFKGE